MGNVYAVADIHGVYDIWQQIKNFLKLDDTLYVLGDCADRGPDGFKIIQEVINHPQCIYIKGNHEDLFIQSMKGDKNLHYYNGGAPTYNAWKDNGADSDLAFYLNHLPVVQTYYNKQGQTVRLTHAGYTPVGECDILPDEYDLIWDRYHINNNWEEGFDEQIIVHGHTPIPSLHHYLVSISRREWNIPNPSQVKGAYWYCRSRYDGECHKVDIDCGTFFTGRSVLLNLDTWEETMFYTEIEEENE